MIAEKAWLGTILKENELVRDSHHSAKPSARRQTPRAACANQKACT